MTILTATLLVAPLSPSAQAKDVSVEFFYDSLDPYGEWIQTADYGFVFHPKDVQEDWRPYTDGSWAYTDAGWTWVSEEPFGGITYHYGRWTRLQDTGWVWVPDTEWAPAWVSWRRSEQYVGWAPLPPEATFKREVGISTWSDSYYDVGPSQYSFVAVRDFGSPRLAKVVLPRRQNTTIITETRNITNITYTSGGIYNDGPQYTVISRESREPVRRLRLERRDDVVFEGHRVRDDGMRATIAGDALRVFAPAVSFRTEVAPPRVARRVEHVEADRGWRDIPQSQELRTRIQQDTPRAPANLPKQPAFTRATAALGLTDNASRKGNLDADGKPRAEREGRSATAGGAPPATENTRPGDRPRPGSEGNVPPNGRKPATAEVKPGQGRPQPATTEPAPGAPRTAREGNDPAKPDAPRKGKGAGPDATAPGREGVKPSTTARPEGAPDSREGKPGREGNGPGAPDAPRKGGPDATAPGREGLKPPTSARPEGAPESREGKPDAPRPSREGSGPGAPDAPRKGGPNTTAPGREGVKPPTSARPEGALDSREGKPDAPRPSREGTGPGAPDAPRKGGPSATAPGREGVKPPTARPEGAPESREGKPDAPRGSKEPKVSAPGGAPEAARRPEGSTARPAAGPAARPSAPATPESKGKKGDKDKDKEKGQ